MLCETGTVSEGESDELSPLTKIKKKLTLRIAHTEVGIPILVLILIHATVTPSHIRTPVVPFPAQTSLVSFYCIRPFSYFIVRIVLLHSSRHSSCLRTLSLPFFFFFFEQPLLLASHLFTLYSKRSQSSTMKHSPAESTTGHVGNLTAEQWDAL